MPTSCEREFAPGQTVYIKTSHGLDKAVVDYVGVTKVMVSVDGRGSAWRHPDEVLTEDQYAGIVLST